MRIEMLRQVDDHAKGAVIHADDEVAKQYIAGGFAKRAADLSPVAELCGDIREAVKAGFAAGAGEVIKANSTGPRIDAGEQQDDRTTSFADFVKQVTIVGCPNLIAAGQFPGVEAADIPVAAQRIERVYKSGYKGVSAKAAQGSRKKDLAEGSGTTGGYTVAPTYVEELLKLAYEESVVRPFAKVKQLPGREAYYPMLNQTTAPTAGNSAFYGGVTLSWLNEAGAGTTAEPNFKQVHIVTNEVQGLAKLSRFLINDSFIPLETELKDLFAGAIAFYEDYAFLQGDGVGKPLGILNSAALLTYGTRANANKFALADAANMMGAMIPQCRPKSVWIATNAAYPQIIQLNNSSSNPTYVNMVGTGYGDAKLAMGQNGLLLFGRPVIFTERLPALGTAGDVLLCDLSKYIVADSGTLEIAASDQYAFNTNQITFRVIKRVDGQPQVDNVITQQDASTTISAFVALHA